MLLRIWKFFYNYLYKVLLNNELRKLEPIFILGCGHSGTTLTLRILAHHKELYGIPYESKFLLGRYVKYSLVYAWNKTIKEQKKLRWIEKTPSHVRVLDRLFNVFPKAKVIFMVRDGRDVVVSIRKRYGNSKIGMERWIDDNKLAINYLGDKRILQVRLEDLANDAKGVTQQICKHIGVEFYEDVLNYQNTEFKFHNAAPEKTEKRDSESHLINRVWQVNQPVFKNVSRWREEATDEEVTLFEDKEFNDLLKRFQYI